jgi:hypothetical protein
MTPYDGLSMLARKAIEIFPFLIGYAVLRRENDLSEVLKALVIAALLYAFPILWEVRMSPQLHTQLYGFFPHDFSQQMRAGGFRAVVFLGHGLVVAIFVAMALLAAIGLWRQRVKIFNIPPAGYAGFLVIVLVLCKSFGALVLAAVVGIASYFLRYKRIIAIIAIIAAVIISYPALRGADLVPVNSVAKLAATVSADRALSLQTRLDNEDALLDKAVQKPLFGWGGWGRSRIYTPHWSGEFDVDISITDGSWIIVVGQQGWLGYIATFGLLVYPAWRAIQNRQAFAHHPSFAFLLVVLIVNLLDLVPNSSLSPITWLIAGALSGFRPGTDDRIDVRAKTAKASAVARHERTAQPVDVN